MNIDLVGLAQAGWVNGQVSAPEEMKGRDVTWVVRLSEWHRATMEREEVVVLRP